MSSVSVVAVNYNHSKVTEALLDSIASINDFGAAEVIVVDNGSSLDPTPQWRLKYSWVKFIRSERNLGFAGGNNLGIKDATGDYLFFINNDTEVTAGLMGKLVAMLDADSTIGMVSPKIRYYDQPDVIQYAGFSAMNYYTARTVSIGQGEKDKGQYDHLTGDTGFIHGAAMMVRREAISKAGLMHENYFLYFEEMDWCERIRKAGYKICVHMQAVIYHKESVSVGSTSALKEYFMNRNRILFIRRNCDPSTIALFWLYFAFVVTPRNMISYIMQKRWDFVPVLIKAIAWNITNRTDSDNLGFPVNNR